MGEGTAEAARAEATQELLCNLQSLSFAKKQKVTWGTLIIIIAFPRFDGDSNESQSTNVGLAQG